MIRCIVLDVDDTVYLERDYVRSGCTAVGRWASEQWGVPGLGDEAWRLFELGCRGHLFDRALRNFELPVTASSIAALVSVYREHQPA